MPRVIQGSGQSCRRMFIRDLKQKRGTPSKTIHEERKPTKCQAAVQVGWSETCPGQQYWGGGKEGVWVFGRRGGEGGGLQAGTLTGTPTTGSNGFRCPEILGG